MTQDEIDRDKIMRDLSAAKEGIRQAEVSMRAAARAQAMRDAQREQQVKTITNTQHDQQIQALTQTVAELRGIIEKQQWMATKPKVHKGSAHLPSGGIVNFESTSE